MAKNNSEGNVCNLFVGNLPFTLKSSKIKAFFSAFGTILSIDVPPPSSRNEPFQNRGIAFISMESEAMEKLLKKHEKEGLHLEGRALHLGRVLPRKDRKQSPDMAAPKEPITGFTPAFQAEFPWLRPLPDAPRPWEGWGDRQPAHP